MNVCQVGTAKRQHAVTALSLAVRPVAALCLCQYCNRLYTDNNNSTLKTTYHYRPANCDASAEYSNRRGPLRIHHGLSFLYVKTKWRPTALVTGTVQFAACSESSASSSPDEEAKWVKKGRCHAAQYYLVKNTSSSWHYTNRRRQLDAIQSHPHPDLFYANFTLL